MSHLFWIYIVCTVFCFQFGTLKTVKTVVRLYTLAVCSVSLIFAGELYINF